MQEDELYSETDEYLFYFHKQYQYFLNYINKNIEEVYHYTSNSTLELILKNSTMRFSNINYLNDECEFTYLYTVLQDLIPKYKNLYSADFCKIIKEICMKYCDEKHYYTGEYVKQDIERQFYVASFSLADDNLALWTLYSKDKNFIGCNFALKPEIFFQSGLNGSMYRGTVIYSEQKQIDILDELLRSWHFKYERSSFLDYFNGDMQDALYKYALFFKHPAFKQESEYRVVFHPAFDYDIKNKESKTYIDIPFMAKDEITSVKLSPTQRENEYVENIKNIFSKYNATTKEFSMSDIPFCNN